MSSLVSNDKDKASKVRSVEHEQELDRKILEIQRRNREIEERQKVRQDEAKRNGLPRNLNRNAPSNNTVNTNNVDINNHPGGRAPLRYRVYRPAWNNAPKFTPKNAENAKSEKYQTNKQSRPSQHKQQHQWTREWDSGKLPTEKWNMNVPEIENDRKKALTSPNAKQFHTDTRGPRRPDSRNIFEYQNSRGRVIQLGRKFLKASEPNTDKRRPTGFFHDDRLADSSAVETVEDPVSLRNRGLKPRRRIYVNKGDCKSSDNVVDNSLSVHRKDNRRVQVLKNNDAVEVSAINGTSNKSEVSMNRRKPNSIRNRRNLKTTSLSKSTDKNDIGNDTKSENSVMPRPRQNKRRYSRTRGDVRQVVRSIIYRVCIEAGDFNDKVEHTKLTVGGTTNKRHQRGRFGFRKRHFVTTKKTREVSESKNHVATEKGGAESSAEKTADSGKAEVQDTNLTTNDNAS